MITPLFVVLRICWAQVPKEEGCISWHSTVKICLTKLSLFLYGSSTHPILHFLCKVIVYMIFGLRSSNECENCVREISEFPLGVRLHEGSALSAGLFVLVLHNLMKNTLDAVPWCLFVHFHKSYTRACK